MNLDFDRFQCPHPPYSASDNTTFAWVSTARRWPVILTNVIDDVHTTFVSLQNSEAVKQGQKIIEQISGLKYEIGHNRAIPMLQDDGEPNIAIYNNELARLQTLHEATWFSCPWLFGECYMYRRLRQLFAISSHWKDYDPFAKQKQKTFSSSYTAVITLAKSLQKLQSNSDQEMLKLAFLELATACLWGNATDLSLLTNLSHEDIQKLQSSGSDRASNVLANDLADAWETVSSRKGGRIDFILDNAGFELYTDLIFADWLISSGLADQIVFHPKNIGWFVSDVIPADFTALLNSLSNAEFFADSTPNRADKVTLLALSSKWKSYLEDGKWKLSIPLDAKMPELLSGGNEFWSTPLAFHDLPTAAPSLYEELRTAKLTIWKGDLNYRKLTGDAVWPVSTSFAAAIGPLAGKLAILALRTCKADVVVGLDETTKEKLDAQDKDWRINGKWAVIQFCNRQSA